MFVRVLAVLVCLVAFDTRAAAQSTVLRRPTLHWVRGEDALDCVGPRQLSEHVEQLVGPVLVRAPDAEHSVEGLVSRLRTGALRVEVRVLNVWGGKVGERNFEHKSNRCEELTPAIAFVIAMMIDPDVAAHGLPPALVALLGEEPAEEKLMAEVEGMPPAPPPPVVAQVRAPARAPELPKQVAELPPTANQLGLLLRGGWREAPRATLGLELRYQRRVRFEWLSVGGYMRYGQQVGVYKFQGGRKLSVANVDFGVQVCGGQRSQARVRVMGCLGMELDNVIGHGSGFSPDKQQILNVGAGVAQLTTRVRIVEPLGLMVTVSGRAAFATPEFYYRNVDGAEVPAYAHQRFSGGVALGPSLEF